MNKKRLYLILGIIPLLLIFWALSSPSEESKSDIFISPEVGEFKVSVTATGELQAKNSVKIYGPTSARMARIYQMKLSRLVPEGTVVKKGDFVAEIDPSEISNKIKDEQLEVQQAESKFLQTKLDTTLTLTQARDDLVNLKYAVEEAKLNKEQSRYEAPAFKRKAEIDYEKAIRAYEQATNNYQTKRKKAQAQMKEIQAELSQHNQKLARFANIQNDFKVMAPADGMVIYHKEWNGQKITEGSMVQAWDPVVATLPDLSIMESITYVNEVDIKKISEGQNVNISLDADAEKFFTGTVTKIASSFRVTITVPLCLLLSPGIVVCS
jgi:multidrug efflux pump subunit AcrA (membrane-fusion protein)